MSRRTSIVKALVEKLKLINGTGDYSTNMYDNVHPKLKYWDECNQFPAIYVVAGPESREYHPSAFTWGFLNVSIKVYVKGEEPQDSLETLLEEVEKVIDGNRALEYDSNKGYETTDMHVTGITTDEGLLSPYGVGEINLLVRYELPSN